MNLLKQKFDIEHFQQIESSFRRHYDMALETVGLDGNTVAELSSRDYCPSICSIVSGSSAGAKRCLEDRLRSLTMAFDTGQPYTSYCHAGIVVVCIPIMDQDEPLGGLFFGKCLSEQMCEAIERDMENRLVGLTYKQKDLFQAADYLPVVPARSIHDASQFLFILLYQVTELDPRVIHWRSKKAEHQSQIGEFIHQSKRAGSVQGYPYQSELMLVEKVRLGDRTGAHEMLNEILGTVLYQHPGQLNVFKARLLELLGILSRVAAEAGVEIDTVLEKNVDYIQRIMQLGDQQEICAWSHMALSDFIDRAYALHHSGKTSRLEPALGFMQKHFSDDITLEDVARATHLSVSRLSHLFKEQFGNTVIGHLNSLRVNRAKYLLLATEQACTQICFSVGFRNLSYFNRVFKQQVQMTPSQFRSHNRR